MIGQNISQILSGLPAGVQLEAAYGGVVESFILDTLRTAGPSLNIVPILSK